MKLVDEQIEVIDTVLQTVFGFVRYSSRVWDDTLEEKTYPHITDGKIDKVIRVITRREEPISYELLTRKICNDKLNDSIIWKYDDQEKEPIKIIERRDINNRLMIKEIKSDRHKIKQQLRYRDNIGVSGLSIAISNDSNTNNYVVTNICNGDYYSFIYKSSTGDMVNVILDSRSRCGHLAIIGKDKILGVETVTYHKNGFRILFWSGERKTTQYSYAYNGRLDRFTKSLNKEFDYMRREYEGK